LNQFFTKGLSRDHKQLISSHGKNLLVIFNEFSKKKNHSKFNRRWFENYKTTNMYNTLLRAFRLSRAFRLYRKHSEGPHGSIGWRLGHKTNTYNVVKIPPSKKKGSYTSFRTSKYMFSLFQDLKCRVWRPPLVWHFTLEVRVVTDLVEDLKSISLSFALLFTFFQDLKFRVSRPLLVWGLFQCRG